MADITINLTTLDKSAEKKEFGVPGLFFKMDATAGFPNRTKDYYSLTDILEDFTSISKEYFAAQAVFSQNPKPEYIKLMRMNATGGETIADAVTAIEDEDSGAYDVFTTLKDKQSILDLAAAFEGTVKEFFACNEDAGAYDSVSTTDTLASLAALNYHRTSYTYHHNAGVDSVSATCAIASDVVTVTETGHTLRVGDRVVVSGHGDAAVDGLQTVDTVVDVDTFTFKTTGAVDSAGPDALTYFARYTFFEGALIGLTATYPVGKITYKFKTPTGQEATPKTLVTTSQLNTIINKKGNAFFKEGGIDYYHDGQQVSGRFTDVQRIMDWIDAELRAALLTRLANENKLAYTNAGLSVIELDMSLVFERGLSTAHDALTELDSENRYLIEMPDVLDIAQDDRTNRKVPNIPFKVRIKGAVHEEVINGTLLI